MVETVSPDAVAGEQLRAFIERIERLEEERKSIAADIGEVYAEAKGNGFDKAVIKKIVRIRAQDHNERMEQEALLELYLTALGMSAADSDDEVEPPRARAREGAGARAREGAGARAREDA